MTACFEGNRRRFEVRRARIAAGLPVKPHGQRIKGRRKWEPIEISRARAMVMSELIPLEQKERESQADIFDRLRLKALRMVEHILDLKNDEASFESQAEHHKRLRMQLEAAQGHLANSIKVDDQQFRQQEREDLIGLMQKKLALIKIPQKGD